MSFLRIFFCVFLVLLSCSLKSFSSQCGTLATIFARICTIRKAVADVHLAGFFKTFPPNGPLPSSILFAAKNCKVAIIETKSATIAFFSLLLLFPPRSFSFSFPPFEKFQEK